MLKIDCVTLTPNQIAKKNLNLQGQKIDNQVFTLENKVEAAIEKTHVLVVRVVDFKGKEPIENVSVKIFKLEKNPITIGQWAENLKNGSPFKRLIASVNSDKEGNVTTELAEGSYEIEVEKYRLTKVCELTQNESVVFAEPKKHWWQ